MTFLQTSTPRKSLITAYLRPGNGGCPPRKLTCESRQQCRRDGAKQERRGVNGAPGRSRTSDLLVRSQLLYPAELRAHIAFGCNSLTILEFAVQSKRLRIDRMRIWKAVVRPEGFE